MRHDQLIQNEELDELLENLPIQDVWGIGSRYSRLLQSRDILTAKDLKYANQRWIRKHLTVVGEGYAFSKCGVFLSKIVPQEVLQADLVGSIP